jgi:3alpha(or 20beta)-hydroxysteroid dehydrogenase
MGRVDGKVALITGGARGMGASHARLLVAEGAKVVIGDILDDEGRALAEQLGPAARYVHLDVTDEAQWHAAVATAIHEYAGLTVLVNNAGIVALGKIGKFDMSQWHKVIDVNLTGTFLGMQAVVDAMKAAGGGSIINVSSIEGLRGAPMVHPYVASKWAVRGGRVRDGRRLGHGPSRTRRPNTPTKPAGRYSTASGPGSPHRSLIACHGCA